MVLEGETEGGGVSGEGLGVGDRNAHLPPNFPHLVLWSIHIALSTITTCFSWVLQTPSMRICCLRRCQRDIRTVDQALESFARSVVPLARQSQCVRPLLQP